MSFGSSIVVGANTYVALPKPGTYMDSATTVDQPILFDLQSSPVPDGTSSLVAKIRQFKNATGGPDTFGQVHLVWKRDTKSFTQAEMEALQLRLVNFLTTTNLTKLDRGEL